MTTREDLHKFIRLLSDRDMYEMGAVLHTAFMDYYGQANSGIGDNLDIANADELLSLLWAVSTEDGAKEPPE